MSIGIDIGRYQIKIVQIQKTPKGYTLQNFGMEPVFDKAKDYDPERLDEATIIAAADRLMTRMKINPRRVKSLTTGLSNQQSSIRQIKMMNTDDEDELSSALQFEARKHIPMDGTDALMDFQILGEDIKEMDKLNVLLVASTQRNLENHLKMIKNFGLRPGIVDSEAIAMANSYVIEHGLPEDGANVFLNIGAVSSTLVVWGRQAPFFTRDIQIGGHHFTKELVEKREIGYQEAEALKCDPGFDELSLKLSGAEQKDFTVSVAEHTIYDNLVDEIRRSLRFYIKESNESYFHKILLMGASTAIKELDTFISNRLNVPAEAYNPIAQLHHDMHGDVLDHGAYAVAIGYAMRGLLE
ncbi:MAG: type IV pilus assembly protein PilM [Candidatus Marinimicrobia bacterium]|nr:type IV pilus assembly protein PilM [Candidatus Neomarinimicrobiota bacterium]